MAEPMDALGSPGWTVRGEGQEPIRECDLCHRLGTDVRATVVTWRVAEEHGDERYASLLRCRDHAACRDRVLDSGDPWPVLDAMPATRPEPRQTPVPVTRVAPPADPDEEVWS